MFRIPLTFSDRRRTSTANRSPGSSRRRRLGTERRAHAEHGRLSQESLEARTMMAADIIEVTTSLASGNYGVGQHIPITVEFDEAVLVSGTPRLQVNTAINRFATYTGQTGGAVLNFLYVIQPGDVTSDFDVVLSPTAALQMGTIVSAVDMTAADRTVGGVAGVDPSISTNKDIAIDTVAPNRPTVNPLRVNPTLINTVPPAQLGSDYFVLTGTSGTGGPLPNGEVLTVTTNGATYTPVIQADGTWRINLLTHAFTGGLENPWSSTNVASYNVVAQVTDSASNVATDLSRNEITIDMAAPSVTGVSSPNPDGTYGIGDEIFIDVTFSEPVRVVTQQGTPVIQLNATPTASIGYFDSVLPPGNVVRFLYTVRPGDSTTDLDYVGTTAIAEMGGRIQDLAGNQANLELSPPPTFPGPTPPPPTGPSLGGMKNIAIDTVVPTVADVYSTLGRVTGGSPGTPFQAVAGDVISVNVQFSEEVVVSGTPGVSPTVAMLVRDRSGALLTRYAYFAGQSSANTLTFNYTVQTGDTAADLTYVSRYALSVGPGFIQDLAGNDANLVLPARNGLGSLGFNNDIQVLPAPVVRNVRAMSPTVDGTYSEGSLIRIGVAFDRNVTVEGTPTLRLNSAIPNAIATYVSGSGTRTLRFEYLVRPFDSTTGTPDNQLDYSSINDLQLGDGGEIYQPVSNVVAGTTFVSQNNAVLTLPTPGQTNSGSLAYNNNIVIVPDTTAPATPTLALLNDNGSGSTDGVTNDGTVVVGFLETSELMRWQPFINGVAFGPVRTGPISTVADRSFVLPVGNYPAGTVTVRQWDPSNNPSALGSNSIAWTIDATSPLQFVNAAFSDSNLVGDGVTNAPTITVTGLEANARIVVRQGSTLVQRGTVGVAAIDLTNDFENGAGLSISQEDLAGNESLPTPLGMFALDRQILPLTASYTDTGASSSDGITNNPTISVSGLEAATGVRTVGGTLQLSIDGGTTFPYSLPNTTSGTTAAINLPADGVYAAGSIVVRQSDLAGNVSPVTVVNPGKAIVLDTVISTPVLGPLADDGSTYPVNGLEVNADAVVTVNGSPVRSFSFPRISGTSVSVSLDPFVYAPGTIVVRQTDLAGNTIQVSNAETVDVPVIAYGVNFGRSFPGPNYFAAVTTMTIRFNAPVTGFSLDSIRLLWNGRSVSTRTMVLTGSGSEYRLTIPRVLTNRSGDYQIEINGSRTSIQATNGTSMTRVSNIFWKRI